MKHAIRMLMALAALVLAPPGSARGDLTNVWQKAVVISNQAATALTDYQVRLAVAHDTDMQSDFDDLRFEDAAGDPLAFWVEQYEAGVSADVWVRVPSIPANDTAVVYMTYGDSNAASASDGDATFEFFDDFSGTTLKDGWTFWNPGGNDDYSLTERPGWMRIKVIGDSDTWSSANGAPFLYISLSADTNYVIRAREDASGVASGRHQLLAWIRSFSTGSEAKGYFGAYTAATTLKYEADGTVGSSMSAASAVHYTRLRKVGGTVYYDGSSDGTAWTAVGSHTPASVPGYWGLGGKSWGGGSSFNADFDYFLVRRYATAEPVAEFGSAEPLPVILIAGRVTDAGSGAGVDGVQVNFSGGAFEVTAEGGYYGHLVPVGWSGTVTPTYPMATSFDPTNRSFASVVSDDTNANFTVALQSTGLGTGGSVTDVGGYRIHAFTNVGAFTNFSVSLCGEVDILVVAGGGGTCGGSGGGGAGGVIYTNAYTVAPGTYAITVGSGGTGAAWPSGGGTGGNSSFDSLTALGGGYGSHVEGAGGSGGSGGGGAYGAGGGAATQPGSDSGGYGNTGGSGVGYSSPGYPGGSGGGAGGPGNSPSGNNGANGGVGLEFAQFAPWGYPTGWFGGGGASGTRSSGTAGTGGLGGGGDATVGAAPGNPGKPNTGGGGGAAGEQATGGAGGSGIVLIRYPLITSPTISGRITNAVNGLGIEGITILVSGTSSVTTVFGGYYTAIVPVNWTGTITPVCSGVFTPAGRSYEDVTASIEGADFSWDPQTGISAIGGVQAAEQAINGIVYSLHAFTNAGTTTNFIVSGISNLEVLVVAGGGGTCGGSGGGGAGGVVHTGFYAVSDGSYTVTVGNGGAGAGWASGGAPGGNSVFDTLTALGGGYGSHAEVTGGSGGSGGGGAYNGTGGSATQPGSASGGYGNTGGTGGGFVNPGYPGGSGGGAGGPGNSPSGNNGANGGIGLKFTQFSAFGYPPGWFGGGGASGTRSSGTAGTGGAGGGGNGTVGAVVGNPGRPNTGGGGGAAGEQATGGAGGSGIVLVRYAYTEPAEISGRITDSGTGAGVDGVVVEFSGLDSVTTAGGGYYTGVVGGAWSGTVTPTYVSGVFIPSSRVYTNVQEDQAGQDYQLLDVAAPGSFDLLGPTNGSVLFISADLQWEPATDTEAYDVYVGVNEDPVWRASVTTNTMTWAFPGDGTQQWFVVARNAAGSNRAPETGTWEFLGYTPLELTGNVTIAETNFSYDQKAVIKNGGTLTINGPHTFASLILTNGATLTHAAATTTNAPRLELTVLETLNVSSNSSINVSGKGYRAGRTQPNSTTNASSGSSGGSYGGRGGDYNGTANALYGDFRNPNEPGSGGAAVGDQCPGGGLVRITAGTLQLDGTILANGTSQSYYQDTAGGSGGGIYLNVSTLAGSGEIRAAGGNANYRGAGGGGRIAVYYDTLNGFDVTGRVSAAGGTGSAAGAPGTVFLQAASAVGQLLLDRKTGGTGSAWLWLPDGAESYEGEVVIQGTGTYVEVRSAGITPIHLTLLNGGVLTHAAATTVAEYRLEVNVLGTLAVLGGARIDVSGRGYRAGRTYPNTTTNASAGSSGGSYGGRGGNYNGTANAVYGDFRNPNEVGSGGAAVGDQCPGGGLIRITAGTLQLDGAILANGTSQSYYQDTAGGSGGGVYISVGTFAGTGEVRAVGGNANYRGAGGGGRIAVLYETLSGFDLTGRVSAAGGTGSVAGSPGTVYMKAAGDVGCVVIDRKGGGTGTTTLGVPQGAPAYAENATIKGTGVYVEVSSAAFTPTNFSLVDGAVLSHASATASQEFQVALTVSGTLYISTNCSINVSGRGYLPGRTYPNTTNNASTGNTGGSYGGLGGGTTSPVYGDFRNPNEPGSGSGPINGSSAGGGLVRIAAGTLHVDGGIYANGNNAGGAGGGAAGGGIRLDVGTLKGSGQITCNGGTGDTQYSPNGYGGGGGRIAVYYDAVDGFDLTNRLSALGATGAGHGSAGTIFLKQGSEPGTLLIWNKNITRNRNTPVWLPAGTNYTENIVVSGTGQVAEITSAGFEPANLWVKDAATLVVNGDQVLSNVYLAAGGKLTHTPASASQDYLLNLIVKGVLSVASNSAVDVTGMGWLKGRTYPNNTTNGAATGTAGGSYGGLGGAYNGTPNAIYGDYRNPNEKGSGAGAANSGGAGGGLLRLTVNILDLAQGGGLWANGGAGGGASGGGAGGGLYVDVLTLRGAGTISAAGGKGDTQYNPNGGGGGGGRVAVYYGALDGFVLTNVTARGGAGNIAGSTGSVHLANQQAPVRLSALSPWGFIPGPVTQLDIRFSTPLQEGSLDLSDIDFRRSGGEPIGLASVVQTGPFSAQIGLAAAVSNSGLYTVTIGTNVFSLFGARPEAANSSNFYIIAEAPNPPVVTNFAYPPLTNDLRAVTATLQGTRGDDSSVWIGGVERATNASGEWAASVSFTQGLNYVSFFAKDLALNSSETNVLVFLADTVAPAVTAVTPSNGSFTNEPPTAIRLTFTEATSGLDWPASTCTVMLAGSPIEGEWAVTTNTLTFTPAATLGDGYYDVSARLQDRLGNSSLFTSAFYRTTWLYDTTIVSSITVSTNDTSLDNKSILIRGATVTINGRHAFSNLYLINGARIQHSAATASVAYETDLDVGGLLYVSPDSAIDVSGRGYLAKRTWPNTTNNAATGYSGGSYGGLGGPYSGVANPVYGSFLNPNEPGSGGGQQAGGGLVRLQARRLELWGYIAADGVNGGYYSGGGSGGGIRIDAQELAGTGQVRARGGNSSNGYGGSGGGGRIALYYQVLDGFEPGRQVTASGGGTANPGSAGTIYLQGPEGPGTVVYDSQGISSGVATPFWLPDEGQFNGFVTVKGAGLLVRTAWPTNTLPPEFLVDSNATLLVDTACTFSNVTVLNGAKLSHSPATSAMAYGMDAVVLGTLLVSTNSSIDVSGRGYVAGRTWPNTTTNAASGYSGGSYGGVGGAYSGSANPIYGDFRNPDAPGSGGAQQAGGGLVRLLVNRLELNGLISADGNNGGYYSGSGSGGGIRLEVKILAGAGQIRANGGNSSNGYGGSGGGGRIALYYEEVEGFGLTNSVSAVGGGSANQGSAGTIYLKKTGEIGELLMDSKNVSRTLGTPLWVPDGTNYEENVTVRGTGQYAEVRSAGLVISNMRIIDGAVLTHAAATAATNYSLNLTVLGTLHVASNSAVSASGKGYPAGRTYPNTTTNASTSKSGGSYGGLGGLYSGNVNPIYGDFRDPNEVGSGGAQQPGGGLIRLQAGRVELEGVISADGTTGGAEQGAGSGGGIRLDVTTLVGYGQVRALGGGSGYWAGAGGGGRIALYYEDASGFDLTNRVTAAGGSYDVQGAAGTVYLQKSGERGRLVIDRKGGGNKAAWLWLPEGTNFTEDVMLRGTGTIAEVRSSGLTPSNMYIVDSAVLTHSAATAATNYSLNLTVLGTLHVASNSAVSASGKGYLAGRTYPNTTTNASTYKSGGSYGGLGGAYSGNVNPIYGDFRDPNEVGSGGVQQPGGGLIRLQAGRLELEGVISADGTTGGAEQGAGSGGGIRLDVTTLVGYGQVRALG
ncbi:MAG: DUF2341 domain-containing protein, partial [Kiritimatiellae bacterium]|nr:DUF2341 domain-containing protein [Kiritimatiellia bacterium]